MLLTTLNVQIYHFGMFCGFKVDGIYFCLLRIQTMLVGMLNQGQAFNVIVDGTGVKLNKKFTSDSTSQHAHLMGSGRPQWAAGESRIGKMQR